jgi:putative transposase
MAKATTTTIQRLNYQAQHADWFAANQAFFNAVVAFYFDVIQAHEKVLELNSQEALRALEQLTHATTSRPNPVMPLSTLREDIPAMFRRAAINAALGSAKSFYCSSKAWRSQRAWHRPGGTAQDG